MTAKPELEPNAEARQFAHAMHQMFIAMRQEGFTERQAILIIGELFKANAQQQAGTDE